MKRKSDAREGFSLLAQHDGVPITIICDNTKEQIMGKFCCKCHEVGTCVKQTEPYTPWSNAAEGTIWELNMGLVGKWLNHLVRLSYCLELDDTIPTRNG